MPDLQPTFPTTHRVRLDPAGRMLIPARLRQRLNVKEGDTLLLTESESGLRIQTLAEVVKETQDYVRQFIPAGVSLVDELLQERRDEAARD